MKRRDLAAPEREAACELRADDSSLLDVSCLTRREWWLALREPDVSANNECQGLHSRVDPVVPSQARAEFTVPYNPGRLTAIASLKGSEEIGRATITTAEQLAAVRLTSDIKKLRTSRDELAHVLVEIVDRHGQIVPDAIAQVHFAVNGSGELAGVANGNPENLDSFRQPHRYTWHGKAQAIIRPAKQPGHVTLTGSESGLRPAKLTLPVAASRPREHVQPRRTKAHLTDHGLGWPPRDQQLGGRIGARRRRDRSQDARGRAASRPRAGRRGAVD
ncbi:MAG: hypothetical protein JOZ73_09065 [Solirubrobacterales bacterium]|nr:hypothetical protein [Solirubrobacterales bacterium]